MYVIPRPTKTYFYTDKVENRFPSEFIQSKNKRQIKVLSCKLKYKDFLVGDIKVHASFIERDHYVDYFCIMANSNNTHTQCAFHIIRLRLIIFHTPKNFHGEI